MMKEFSNCWGAIKEGYSQQLMDIESEIMSSDNTPSRSKMITQFLLQISLMKQSLSGEKRAVILKNQQSQWDILRKQTGYSKSEFKERISLLNKIHLVKEFSRNTVELREEIDGLEAQFRLGIIQQNLVALHSKQLEPNGSTIGRQFKLLLNMGESLTLKLSGV